MTTETIKRTESTYEYKLGWNHGYMEGYLAALQRQKLRLMAECKTLANHFDVPHVPDREGDQCGADTPEVIRFALGDPPITCERCKRPIRSFEPRYHRGQDTDQISLCTDCGDPR